MSYNSKYKGAEVDALLDKVNEDYEVKSYADYADYNADTSRGNKTISFVEQDNSVWVQGKQYSMNAGCYVGSDKADVSTTAWYLAGTLNVAAIGWDIQCLGYCTNSLLSEGGGLFVLNLRFNSATDIQIKKFAWLVKTGSTPNLRLVVSEGKVRLYVFVAGGQYRGANIRILTESTSAKRDVTFGARNFFGLSDNTTPEATEPVGTDIADVPYLLKNGTAATATKLQTPRSFKLGGGLTGAAVNFDGTGNVELEGGLKSGYTARWADTLDEKLFARFFSIGSKAIPTQRQNTNYVAVLLITSSSNPNAGGVLNVSVRKNGSGSNSTVSLVWLCKFSDFNSPSIYIGFNNAPDETYLDLFIKEGQAWQNFEITLLRSGISGLDNSTNEFYLYNANYSPTGTTTEHYESVADAGKVIHGHTDDAGYSSASTTSYGITIKGWSQKTDAVRQAVSTGDYKRRVLLGGDNDNEEYLSTYKTKLLTYNPAKGEFEITDTASSFILSPTSPWFKLPTALWDRGFWLKCGDTSLGRLIGAKGEVSDIEYYYIGGTYTNPDFKFNPATKTMEANASTATTAETADVANKTKYPLIVASGDTQFNWYADSTLKITIPEEMLASAANGVFVMKVPEIEKAKSVTNNDLSNTTELTLPAIHSVTDGMSLGQSPIKLNVGENSLNVNISGKSATSGTADVANKTKYPLILRQDGTNVVSWFADSTVILDVPSEMIKSATSGGITLARANRTFVAVATGGELFTDETGGRIITLQNYATFDITPIEGDILILRVVNSIQAQGMYPLVIPYTSANTVAKSIALVRGQNSSGWINWTASQLSAGIYQFACINDGTSLRWALISNNTFNAP